MIDSTTAPSSARTTDPELHRHGAAGVRMDRAISHIPTRLLRALVALGQALSHPWALAIEPRDLNTPITIAEWVDAEEAVARAIAAKEDPIAEPFPLSYHNGQVQWTCEPYGIVLVITRPYREVVAMQEHLLAAEHALVKLNGVGVDGMSQMSADWPTLAPLLNAHKAAVLALDAPTVRQGQIVCGLILRADGSATWHPATEAPPQRAEGRHWRLLMKLIHAAGYALPPIRFSVDLDRALDAMGRYEGLAAATREAGYEVPLLPSDELISWVAWGIKASTNHTALREFIRDAIANLGGPRPPEDVLRLWVITSNADLREIATTLRAQQLRWKVAALSELVDATPAATSKPITSTADDLDAGHGGYNWSSLR